MVSRLLLLVWLVLALGCTALPPQPGPATGLPPPTVRDKPEPSAAVSEDIVDSESAPAVRRVTAEALSYDPATGEIRYTLPEPALVRIRIGIRGSGPLLRTLLDWEARSPGPHTEVWDKRDSTGHVDFSGMTDLMVVIVCISPGAEGAPPGGVRGYRKSPEIRISFPEMAKAPVEGVAVRGRVPVRISVAEKDRRWLTETRFEVALYMDGVFLFEDEEGITPFTFHLDAGRYNEGPHILTANLIGYDGEMGTRSVNLIMSKGARS